jgi:DNA-binding transcriptional MerR regulator
MNNAEQNTEPVHPIRVVAERTGLSLHVLRAWERRHGVVSPTRSEGGQRLYSDADVDRLSLLFKASKAGRALADVAALPNDELSRLVAQDADRGHAKLTPASDHRAKALAAVLDLEPERLHSVLRRAVLSLGTPVFLEQVLTPLLVDIGEEWHAGRITIAHEHAATGAVTQILGWLMRELEVQGDAPRVLLATPAGERHSLGGMIAAAAASHDGWHVTWLGADLPAAQIAAAARRHRANAVGLSVATVSDGQSWREELALLRQSLDPQTPLFVGGFGASALEHIDGATLIRDFTHWRSLLRTHAPARAT